MGRDRQQFRKPLRAVPIRPGPVYLAKYERHQLGLSLLISGLVFLVVFSGGMLFTNWSAVASAIGISESDTPNFAVCDMVRRTCVVDGDTFWLRGEKIRIADIDTPEISEPNCEGEYDRGIKARDRLVVLLNEGPFDVSPIGDRDSDQYGRKLRVVTRNGSSLGDQLVGEGLARTWTGRREPWC